MNSRKLRVLALLLSAIMIFTAVPSTLFAGEFGDGEVVTWDDNTVVEENEIPTDLGFVSDFQAEIDQVEFAPTEFDEGFGSDVLVGDTSSAVNLTGVVDEGKVTFYYHDSKYPDGYVTYVTKQTSGAGSENLLVIKNNTGTAQDFLKRASDGTYANYDAALEYDPTDPAANAEKVFGGVKPGTQNEPKLAEGNAVVAPVEGDCTKIVIAANIQGKIYVSDVFTKWDYVNGKAFEHTWAQTDPEDTTKAYNVVTPATCTEDGEGTTGFTCSVCGKTKSEKTVIKASGHLFKFDRYELGDNAKWSASDSTTKPGYNTNYPPVFDSADKATYSYYEVSQCTKCSEEKKELVTKPVVNALVSYANDKNIYNPAEQLKGKLLDIIEMKKDDGTLKKSIRLTDCTQPGSYDIVVKNTEGEVIETYKVNVPAHHGENVYVTKDSNGKAVALSDKLFSVVTVNGVDTVYSKICVPQPYYLACEWCNAFTEVTNNQPTKHTATLNVKYKDNHDFGVNATELSAITKYEDLWTLVDGINKANKAANVTVNSIVIKPMETVDANGVRDYSETTAALDGQYCDKGVEVTFTWTCKTCGKPITDKKVIEDLFGLPSTKTYTIDHVWKYGEGTVLKAATCTESGLREAVATCKRCGETKTVQYVIPATGHDFDKTKVVTKITGDTVLDSIRDRMYKKGQTHTNTIGFIEDKSISVATGYKCKNCDYIDLVTKTNTLEIVKLEANTIDKLHPLDIDGTITLNVVPLDENGKVIASTLVGADGNPINTYSIYDYHCLYYDDFEDTIATISNDPELTEKEKQELIDAIYAQYSFDNTQFISEGVASNQFIAKFGLVSIDYQPTTVTTEAPAESTTKEAPAESTTEETPAESTTKETPAESTTKALDVDTTTEVPVEPTTEAPAKMPAQVTGLKVTKNSPTKKVIAVKYNAVDNADQYTVNVRTAGSKTWTKNLTDGAVTAYEITGLTRGEAYDIRVAAIAKGIAGPRSAHQYRWLEKVTLDKPKKAGAGAVSVTWSEAPGASKYKVYYSTDKSFKTDVKTGVVKSNSAIVNELEVGKTYYFKVRCYKTIDGITYTGAWSNVKSKIMK